MMKKKLSLVLLLLLAFLFSALPVTADGDYDFEAEIPIPTTQEAQTLKLSLEKTLEKALTDNPSLTQADLAYEKAKLLDRKQKKTSDDLSMLGRVRGGGLTMSSYDRALGQHVGKKQTEVEETIADMRYEVTRKGILIGTENNYYQLLRDQDKLANARGAVKRAADQLTMTQKMYDVGLVSAGEVTGAQAGLSQKEASLVGAQADHEKSMMALAQELSLPLNTEIIATDAFSYTEKEYDLDQVLAEAISKDPDLTVAKGVYEINTMAWNVAQDYLTPNTYDYKEQSYLFADAQLEYQQALVQAEEKIRKAHIDLGAAQGAYLKTVESIEASKENYRVSKLRYQEGLTTRLDLEEAEAAYSEALDAASSMLYNYDLLKSTFEYQLFN